MAAWHQKTDGCLNVENKVNVINVYSVSSFKCHLNVLVIVVITVKSPLY